MSKTETKPAPEPTKPAIEQTVIIPSGGDCYRLEWCLAGLARQERAPAFEVLVVGDMVKSDVADVEELVNKSVPVSGALILLPFKERREEFRAAAARNLGIRHARGEQIVFLDEDCCPDADFLAAHFRHRGKCVYGFRRYFHQTKHAPFAGVIDDQHFRMYSAGDERRAFEHTEAAHWYSCNASAPRDLLLEVGGFDESQPQRWGNEDVQLGVRMRNQGAKFVKLGKEGMVTHFDHPRREKRADFQDAYMKCIRGEYPIVAPGGPLVSAV